MQFKKNDRVAHLAERIFYGTVVDVNDYQGLYMVIISWDGSVWNSSYTWPGLVFWEQTAKLCDRKDL